MRIWAHQTAALAEAGRRQLRTMMPTRACVRQHRAPCTWPATCAQAWQGSSSSFISSRLCSGSSAPPHARLLPGFTPEQHAGGCLAASAQQPSRRRPPHAQRVVCAAAATAAAAAAVAPAAAAAAASPWASIVAVALGYACIAGSCIRSVPQVKNGGHAQGTHAA